MFTAQGRKRYDQARSCQRGITVGPIAATRPPLLPRYRRPFSVSAVLDDTIQVFRQVWLPMVGLNLLVGVLSLLVTGIAIGAFLVAGGLVIVTFFVDVIRAAAATGAATGAGRTAAPAVLPTALPSVPESALAAAVIAGGGALLASALL